MCFRAFIGFLHGIFLEKMPFLAILKGFEDIFDPLYVLEVVLNTVEYTFCYQL